MTDRRHCRFCSGRREIDFNGQMIPCTACQYGQMYRETGARIGDISTVAVYGEDQHGRFFSHTEYQITHGRFSEVTRDKLAAPRIYKQFLELT